MSRRTLLSVGGALLAGVALLPALAVPGSAAPKVAADPRVVTDWNAIAARTIVTENAVPAPVSALYFGFVSLAVYDAVVAVEGRYAPHTSRPRAHRHASPQVAAATAAYRVLSHYFPASAEALAADYAAELDRSPRGVGRQQGERVGRDAAAAVIAAREGDGRDAGPAFAGRDGIGQWKAPEGRTMLAPWLAGVRPLTLRSATQFRPPGPDPLTSEAYARDFAEVKAFGASAGSSRSDAQTDTARFWTASPVQQYHAAMRQQLVSRGGDIVDRARAFALLGSATADALITCWRAKLDTNFWRPDAAIRQAGADGNDATQPDVGWVSLVPAPLYPEYPSGHACVTGASSETFGRLFGTTGLGLQVTSPASPTTKRFDSPAALDADAANGRIWLGIHFRRGMTDANALGHAVASWAATQFFRPTG